MTVAVAVDTEARRRRERGHALGSPDEVDARASAFRIDAVALT
jgi:hypothetical protein